MIAELSNSFGVSGYEEEVTQIIKSTLTELNINHYCDKMGNIIASEYKDSNCPTVLVSCGIDEKGIIVTDITEDGYLKFDTIGDIDAKSLISKRVKSKEINGIISLKAIHLLSKEEREKKVKIDDLCIDIGAEDKKDAKKYVTEGDYFSFDVKYDTLGTSQIKGKALSRAVSVNVLLNTIKNKMFKDVNVIYLFAVQNEIAARGIKTYLNTIPKIDMAIILDCVDANKDSKISLDKGPIIALPNNDTAISKRIIENINSYDIQHQTAFVSDITAAEVFRGVKADIPLITIGIPLGQKQTPINNIYINDIDNTEKLLNKIAEEAKNLVK